ncbi:MAG: hypothetical protein GY866_33570 [Proteobacteria bacterium]|nr:hypothetical protein [Pseudomonadota bacterium]
MNIANPTDVVVIDHYRHPFLSGYGKMQQICFGTALKKRRVDSRSIIDNLNNGVQILQMGWPSNSPYHQLRTFPDCRVGLKKYMDVREQRKITNMINYAST